MGSRPVSGVWLPGSVATSAFHITMRAAEGNWGGDLCLSNIRMDFWRQGYEAMSLTTATQSISMSKDPGQAGTLIKTRAGGAPVK